MSMLMTVTVVVMVMIMIMIMAVRRAWCVVRSVFVHDELRRGQAGTQHARGGDVEAGHGEAAERALQLIERQAGVEKRAERHVARDAREAIEIQQSRHYKLPVSLKLQYRTSPRIR